MKITISRRVILALLFAGQSSIATNHYPVSVPLVHDSTDYSIEADNEEADFEYLDGIDSFGTEDKEDDKPGIAFEKDESVGERSAINKKGTKKNQFFSRIVGGSEAHPGEFKFMVSWHNNFYSKPACGGSLVAPNIVLSAAHCEAVAGNMRVGSINAMSTYNGEPPGVEIKAIKKIVYPGYDFPYNDFMLLQLEEDVDTNIYPPIDLNFDVSEPKTGDSLTAIGFGTLSSSGKQPDALMKVDVPTVSHDICTSQYDGLLEDIHLCAGFPEGGKDSCQGDSGGPIIKEIDGVRKQVGVVSFGTGCADANSSGVYARVSGVQRWLKREICSGSSDPKPSYCIKNYDPETSDREDEILDNFHLASEGSIENEWIVVLKKPEGGSTVSEEELETFANNVAKMTGSEIEVTNVYTSVLLGFTVRGMTEKAARKFLDDELVDFVEQNAKVKADGTTWGLDRIDERNPTLDNSYAPMNNRDGSGVYAYILDTGIRITHDEFKSLSGEIRARWGVNTLGDGLDYDCNGHGTHVAGTVGGTTYGVAKNVNLVAVKVLSCSGVGTYASVISGVDWVKSNAKGKKATANLSLEGPGSQAMDIAIRNLHNSGVLTVVSAGNSGGNACSNSPAREKVVITVGAIASNDYRSKFSNYGPCVDLFAPGQKITAAWNKNDSDRKTISGTSMASSHVCGAVALQLQNGSSARAAEAAIMNMTTKNKVRNAGFSSPNMLLYVGDENSPSTRAPIHAPLSGGSCISGDTGILSKTNDTIAVTQVRDLLIGDRVNGFDSEMNPTSCKIEAIGSFGTGRVYGNYTPDHLVFNPDSRKVERHGKSGASSVIDKYDLIADCPLVEDESGMRFGPMDSDFCGENLKTISWKSYLLLHSAILRVVRQSGAFWFKASSYKDMATVKLFAPRVCKNMLKCIKDNTKCYLLEKSSTNFIHNALTDAAKSKTLETFTNIGSCREIGSVSAIVTGGQSVNGSLIGTDNC